MGLRRNSKYRIVWRRLLACLMLSACTASSDNEIDFSGPVAGWPVVTATRSGEQYSPLTQINRKNVDSLEIAWTYESPEDMLAEEADDPTNFGAHTSYSVETTPVLFDQELIFCTPHHRVVALMPETGSELWQYDPEMDLDAAPSHFCRGVATWTDSGSDPDQFCSKRVFANSGEGRLLALDAKTGKLCSDFGKQGEIDLRANLGIAKPRSIYITSPPLVLKDLVITGSAIRDSFALNMPGGVVRAFDARTGELVWAWDPVGPGMTPVTAEDARSGAIFTRGTPNVWSLMTADIENGLLYLPTGNAPVDFFKGRERAIDYYGSSVVALRIDTGKVAWSFQTVHHDLWDYDVAAQPVLYTHDGGIPAMAVATKQGNVFLLNRLTGEPLFRVEEKPVPQTDIPGEWTSPTQPFPTRPKPLARPVTEKDVLNFPIASSGCRSTFDGTRNKGVFTPPSLEGTLQSPGLSGGFNWGSVSINPVKGLLVGVYLDLPWIVQLKPRSKLISGDDEEIPQGATQTPQYGTMYSVVRRPFLSESGIPCTTPPWGWLIAIELATGKEAWRKPLGSLYGRVPLIGSMLTVGAPVSGGVMQTASGLIFTGASVDEHFRAFDADTGDTLWAYHLPYSAHATPMTYRLSENGKQYLIVATGGATDLDRKIGNALVAFVLPD